MMNPKTSLAGWAEFVLAHGFRAKASDLASVVGQPVDEINRMRATGAAAKHQKGKGFVELFSLWHGREPMDFEWPVPRKLGSHGTYDWQGPELALVASLVGTVAKNEIAAILTTRLRDVTGDQTATRSITAVQLAINRIGMLSSDVIGGITTAEAGRRIGSSAIINHAIHKRELHAMRVGRRWVIPHAAWAAWEAKRTAPPEGFVPLTELKGPLAIRSDKLSEFARFGYIPTALRCHHFASGRPSTKFGTWYIDQKIAAALIADRQAGRPMPWHGKPLADNLRVTFKLWLSRQHPAACKTCAQIWGRKGAPKAIEDYSNRYPPLAHGAKRHLTMKWSAGLTPKEVANKAGVAVIRVRRAVRNGALEAQMQGGETYITRTDATRWIARHCPTGDTPRSWISLETAEKRFLFTRRELKRLIKAGKLKSKQGSEGAARGAVYVSQLQCGALREKIGFTEQEAARRAAVTLTQFRTALKGVAWRNTGAIPLFTLQAVIKRLQSRPGYTIEQAAEKLGTTPSWVEARIADGSVKVSLAKWDPSHRYLSEPMLNRLHGIPQTYSAPEKLSDDWLRLSAAASEAGVSIGTIIKWATAGELERVQTKAGWRYHRDRLREQARRYWANVRFHRASPPAWLQDLAAA